MAITAVAAAYRVRIATAGATVVAGNVDLTLAIGDVADVPVISGPTIDPLTGRGTSHAFTVSAIVDTALFTSSDRLDGIGRLIEIQRADDGGAWSTIATGRITGMAEPDGRGRIDIAVQDERWTERNTEVFRTTDTVQLFPAGLASAWKDKVAAGTTTFYVAEVSGDYVRLQPNDLLEGSIPGLVPAPLRDALLGDLLPSEDQAGGANSAGNFTSLRFRYSSADHTVITFKYDRGVLLGSTLKSGPLGDLARNAGGSIINVWVYLGSGHGLSATDTITGRFYWPNGVRTSPHVPLHLGGANGVHPWTLAKAILDGDHGGDAVLYDSTQMTVLEALPLTPVWADPTEPADRARWLEDNIYSLYGTPPLVGTDLALRPTPLRLPLDTDPAGLTTITATDGELATWEHVSRVMVNALVVRSRDVRPLDDVTDRGANWRADEYEAVDYPPMRFEHDNIASAGEHKMEITTALILTTPESVAKELAIELFDVVGDGAVLGVLRLPDNAGHEAGDLVVLDYDTLKAYNPADADRTGDRVVRLLTFRDYTPASIEWLFLDMGPDAVVLSAPTVSIAQDGTDPDLVNVTISGLGSGETATIECTVAASSPSTYDHIRAGVGNETVAFRVGATAANAYCRAYATKPNRIRSAYATDSVALTTRAIILDASVVIDKQQAVVEWTVASTALGMKTDYDIHDRGTDPTFGSNIVDYDAADGGFTISWVSVRKMVSVKLIPYTGWSAPNVSGSAGDTLFEQAMMPKMTPLEIPRLNYLTAGVYHRDISDRATSGTGEDTLLELTIPGGLMGANGELQVTLVFLTAGTADSKNIKVYWDGVAFRNQTQAASFDDYAVIEAGISNDNDDSAQDIFSEYRDEGGGSEMSTKTDAADTSADVVLKVTAECQNAGDSVTLRRSHVTLLGTN